jgi:tRNA-specific 2-thiouridylase
MTNQKIKGIGLLSGGLDSILAVKVLQEQGLDLLGITFTTPFFGADSALAAGLAVGIEVRVIDITEIHLQMLKCTARVLISFLPGRFWDNVP